MARPTFNPIPDSDLNLDSPGKTQDVFEYLRDNAGAVRIAILGIYLAEETDTSASYQEHAGTIVVHVPDVADYTGIQRLISVTIEVKVSAGTGTFQLKDDASSNVSSEVTSTSTSYEDKTLTLDLDAGWKGTDRTIIVQYKVSGGNDVYVKAGPRYDTWLEY